MNTLYKHFIGIFFLILSLQSFAQKKSQEVLYADKYYKAEDYYLAAEYYQKGYEKHPEDIYAAYMLAECERLFFNYRDAEKYYAIVKDTLPEEYPLALYYYGVMEKYNGKYIPAEKAFEEFIATYTGDQHFVDLATLHYNGCVLALTALQKPQRNYAFQNIGEPINSNESDFSPAIFENDSSIIITSARKLRNHDEIYGKLGGAYLDKYRFVKNDSIWVKLELDDDFEELNTKHHEGAGTFSPQKDKYYFTRCDLPGKRKGDKECGIYVSNKVNGNWEEPVLLNENINVPTEYNAQPTLTATGDTLFFTSKRPGGFGNNDIWASIKTENENWGEAFNLGDKINSPRHEMSANYYPEEGILFFSSDGHESIGGLDIFMTKDFESFRNIGLPFNSNKDDFYFVLGEEKGFLSSNREGGKGHDDIYEFNIISQEALIATIYSDTTGASALAISGKINNLDGSSAKSLNIVLKDTLGNEVARVKTSEDGTFVFNGLDPSKQYEVILEEPNGSLTNELDYLVEKVEVDGIYSTAISDAKMLSISGTILDDKGNPKNLQEVVLVDAYGKELQSTNTNEEGYFMFANLDPDNDYKVMLRDENGNLIPVDMNSEGIVVLGSEKNLNTTSLQSASMGAPSRVSFESIYFDFAKSNLRKEARLVLDDLVDYSKENPSLKIEINGYTDAIGGEDYNKKLGKVRGKAAYNYLVKKGISKSQIVVNSYGESSPIASNNNPVGRQLNRRVEFFIVGGGEYNVPAKIYVLKPNTTLSDVAKKFNMSVSELQEMNGNEIDVSKAYQPVRVRRNENDGLVHHESQVFIEEFEVTGDGIPTKSEYNKDVLYNKYDGSGYYVVLPRNTLYSIAKICGTTISDIKKYNGMKSNFIFPGQKLQVVAKPDKKRHEHDNVTSFADAGLSVKDHQGEVLQVGNTLRYVVKEGDSFNQISKKFDMTIEELRLLNTLDSYELYSGMVLIIKELSDNELNDNDALQNILKEYNK